MLVWINDRCAVIFTPLPLAGCEIGKKPARGDLFEHMDDAVAGDWKE